MKTIVVIAILATFALSPLRADETNAVKRDLDLMQGEWSMVSGSSDGQAIPEQMRKQMKRTCHGNEATTTMAGHVYIQAKISIDPTQKPKTIDFEMIGGVTKGQKQLGIYEVEGDTFKSSFAKPGGERPSDFTSTPGDGRTVTSWKREKTSVPTPQK